jgi:hypothetical protein
MDQFILSEKRVINGKTCTTPLYIVNARSFRKHLDIEYHTTKFIHFAHDWFEQTRHAKKAPNPRLFPPHPAAYTLDGDRV